MATFRFLLLAFLFGWCGSVFGQITGTPDPGYCTATNNAGTAGGLIAIRNVLFNEILGPNSVNVYNQGYRNMNSTFGTASIIQGQMHHMSIQDGNGAGYTRTVRAWIDFNGDGDFDASELVISEIFTAGSGSVISGYFNVPSNAAIGNVNMRVNIRYNAWGVACGTTTSNGQIFDYDVEIKPSISPVAPPVVFDGGNIVTASAGLVHITNVSLGNINNSSVYFGTSTAGYNYSNYTGQYVTSLTSGQTYSMSVSKSNYIATIGVWVDWNNDGDFTDAGEEVYKQYAGSSNTVSFNITPPPGIPHNTETMMRVRVVYDNVVNNITPTNYSTLPAGNSRNNNETEDYRVLLINSGCSVIAGTASLNSGNLSCDATVDLSLTGNDPGTIQWFQSTDNVTFNPIGGATTATHTTAALNPNTTYYFRAEVSDGTCANPSNTVSINTAQVYLHSSNSAQNFTTCNGVYRDAGNTGNYPLNFGGSGGTTTTTFYPCTPGQKLELNFSFLNTDNYGSCGAYHFIRIYNGNSTAAPLIGCYYANQNPGLVASTAADGSLTIQFGTDNYNSNNSGWEASISCSSPPAIICAPVANLAAAIGTPANGTNHHLNVTWDALTGATGYDVEYSTNGTTWLTAGSVTSPGYDFNAGDNPNAPYYFRVRAKDANQTCNFATMATPRYTAADVPAVPTLGNVGSTIDVTLPAETPVANPASTTYSIMEDGTGLYVQANGTLGTTEVFQTKAQWGTVTVNGLTANTEYCFVSKARNNDGHEVGGSGAALSATQEFNSNVITTGGSGNTSVWWAPNSNPPIAYSATGGCPGGRAGYSSAWNNFWGNFLRSPQQNCTGLDEVIMTFDVTHSYLASQPNNRMRFYMWADNAYSRATSVKIGGVEVGQVDINGIWLNFSELRNCVPVEVTYDLTSVSNKSNILYYIEGSCGYNNSNVFSMWLDNITFSEPTATACATTTSCTAGTWTGLAGDNDWNNPANWSCNTLPTATMDVTIPSGVSTYPVLATIAGNPVTGYTRDLTIAPGASVSISGGGNAVEVNRNFTHNGTANMGAGTLRLTNAAAHTVDGNFTIGTLTVEANTSIGDNLNITEALNLVSGTLNTTGGVLTLKSDVNTTAYINDFTSGYTGSVVGNVVVERYVANTVGGFHYIGTPVGGATITGWSDDFNTAGPNGVFVTPQPNCDPNALAQGSAYGGLFDYFENNVTNCSQRGWRVRSAGSIDVTKGYAGVIPHGTVIDLVGGPTTGLHSTVPLTRSTTNTTQGRGMHLVSNPYPSAIDWYAVSNGNAGIDGSAYLWHTSGGYQGTYQVINAVTPGSSFIGSSQGFMVIALNDGAVLNFNNTMRVAGNNSTFARQAQPFDSRLILEVSGNGYQDRTIVALGANFTHGFDREFDGRKMASKGGIMTLYTHTIADIERQATNALPNDRSVKAVPVGFAPGADGTFTFNANDLGTFAAGTLIYLEDKKAGTMTNLMQNPSYTFSSTVGDDEDRFVLHFVPGVELAATDADCDGLNSAIQIDLGVFDLGATTIVWDNATLTDAQGNTVWNATNVNGMQMQTGLQAGAYTLVTEIDGHIATHNITVGAAPAVTAQAVASETEVTENALIVFSNTSQGATTYAWDFGDGSTSTDADPAYSYAAAGTYTATLTATNGTCTSVFTQTITVNKVLDPTGLNEVDGSQGIRIFGYHRTVTVQFSNWKDAEVSLDLYDLTGRKVIDTRTLSTSQAQHQIKVDGVVSGYYFARVHGASGSKVERVYLAE